MIIMQELVDRASEFYYIKQQIDMLLRACEARIVELIRMMKKCDINDIDDVFIELFNIQETLYEVKNKYLFQLEFNAFLNDFIYFFDRKDDYNIVYLYEHFKQYDTFPSEAD